MADLAKINKEFHEALDKNPLAKMYYEKWGNEWRELRLYKFFIGDIWEWVKSQKNKKHAWSNNHSMAAIAEMIGCSPRTIRNKRKNPFWGNSIQADPEHSKKWRILSAAIPIFRKEMKSAKIPHKEK